MPSYKLMYYTLFNAFTDATRHLQSAQELLQQAQITAEDQYLQSTEKSPIIDLSKPPTVVELPKKPDIPHDEKGE